MCGHFEYNKPTFYDLEMFAITLQRVPDFVPPYLALLPTQIGGVLVKEIFKNVTSKPPYSYTDYSLLNY